MSLYIDQDVRANVLAVMSRVHEPRTLADISWHIPHVSRIEVGYTLDVMVLRGEVKLILDPNATKRYVLTADYYRTPSAHGPNPDLLINRTLIAIGAAAAVAIAVLLWASNPW